MRCPRCGAVMREKTGRYGQFLGCSNWPRCNGTRNVNPTDNSMPIKPTRRRAGLKVILPETMNYAFRQNEPRPHHLKIYRQDDEEATTDWNEFLETDQDWMTLEDYCLERDLLLEHTQLIKEGKAITRYHRLYLLPGNRTSVSTINTARSMATDAVVSIAGTKNSWHAGKSRTPHWGTMSFQRTGTLRAART